MPSPEANQGLQVKACRSGKNPSSVCLGNHGEDPRALQGRGGDMSLRGGASIGNLRLPDRCELRLQTLVRRKDRRERGVSLHIEEGCVALVTLPKRQTPRDINLAETLELLFAVRRISGAAHSGSGWSAHDERRDNWLGGTGVPFTHQRHRGRRMQPDPIACGGVSGSSDSSGSSATGLT